MDALIDDSGGWRTDRVPLGRELSVEVHPALEVQYAGFESPPVVHGLHADDESVEIHLRRGLAISGRYLESDGSPPRVDDLLVLAEPLGGDGVGPWAIGHGVAHLSLVDGSYRVGGLQDREYKLLLVSHGLRLDERNVRAGTEDVVVQLPRRDSLRIHVRHGETGGFAVRVRRAGSSTLLFSGASSEEGWMEVHGLPVGVRLAVTVESGGRAGGVEGIAAGGEVTIPLSWAVLLDVPVEWGEHGPPRDEEGRQWSGGSGFFAVQDGIYFRVWVDVDGRISGAVPPGRYDLIWISRRGEERIIMRGVEVWAEE